MELMYPIVIIICLAIGIAVGFIKINKKPKYKKGSKIANTKYLEETEYYKEKIKQYRFLTKTVLAVSILGILINSILIARPVTYTEEEQEENNRDIIIDIDASLSQSDVNLELLKQFKDAIPNIKGDRIGIVVYNTASIVYCPLTEDYDYIIECLDSLIEKFQLVVDNGGRLPTSSTESGAAAQAFWYGGMSVNNETRGSSLVGDGLAGAIYAFPDVKNNKTRTRTIVMATDNAVAGTEIVSLDEACKLCKKFNIFLYAYCPTTAMNAYATKENIASYKNSVEKYAGGKFYTGDLNKMTSSIVGEIKQTKLSVLKTTKITHVTDHPHVFVILLIIELIALIVLEKRIKL